MAEDRDDNASPPPPRPVIRPQVTPTDLRVLILRAAALAMVAALAVLELGFYDPPLPIAINHVLQIIVLACYAVDVWRRGRTGGSGGARHPLHEPGFHWDDWSLFTIASVGAAANLILLLFGWLWPRAGVTQFASGVWWLFELAAAMLLAVELWRLNVALSRRLHRAGLLLPLSFLTLIIVGTGLLMAPRAVPKYADPLSFVDALFTSTSAVCVTGLIVRDTAQLAPYGQAVICILIQLGGLGIIVFGSVMAMLLGARLSLRENLSLSQMLSDTPLHELTRFVRFIVLGTLAIELIGALLLLPMWAAGPGQAALSFGDRAGLSVFHSISAFCNAGFALQSDSLVGYRYSIFVHTVFVGLIVLGGLGFPVLANVARAMRWRLIRGRGLLPVESGRRVAPGRQRLSLHSRIVLITTAACYLIGMLALGAAQLKPYFNEQLHPGRTAYHRGAGELTAGEAARIVADASFMSVTARTAGFNTQPMDELEPASRFTLVVMMMVGASPGGTGGGMKTTTVALLMLGIAATIRRRRHVEAFGRQIAEDLVRKAGTLAACFVLLVTCSTMLLLLSEPFTFGQLLFESVSAANTVGLSLGVTPQLTAFGKTVVIVTMFLGRIGPLAVLAVFSFGASRERAYRYAHENVLIG